MNDKKRKIASLKDIVSLCKRRGFIFPGSEIYGGFANTYSYGPYGSALKKNIKDLWWKRFVQERRDIVGIDGPILLHPKAWEASGHVQGFNDALIDCKECKSRYRADHLIESELNIVADALDRPDMRRPLHVRLPGQDIDLQRFGYRLAGDSRHQAENRCDHHTLHTLSDVSHGVPFFVLFEVSTFPMALVKAP